MRRLVLSVLAGSILAVVAAGVGVASTPPLGGCPTQEGAHAGSDGRARKPEHRAERQRAVVLAGGPRGERSFHSGR